MSRTGEIHLSAITRVPPYRRIDPDGHPTVAELEEAIRADRSPAGLLAVERNAGGGAIGYCGLVDSGRGAQEPELAFEFLRRFWGLGYATEASWAVLDWARASGYERLRATRLGLEHRFAPGAGQGRFHRDRP